MESKTGAPPHGPMRRKDREILDRREIDEILGNGKVMHLALANGPIPFVVPLFYAYDGHALYFHSAQEGTKIAILKQNPNVCFEVSIDHGVVESDQACDFEAAHRTVIGFGLAHFVESETDKAQALDRIVARFSPRKFDYPPERLRHTIVVRIEVSSVRGKKFGV